jgi:hypothetical protein
MHICHDEINMMLLALEHFPFVGSYLAALFRNRSRKAA